MSIDNNHDIPSIIILYNFNAIMNDNQTEEDLPFYDAEPVTDVVVVDSDVKEIDDHDNIEPSVMEVNDNNATNDYVIVNVDKLDVDNCNDDDKEVVVVTDESLATAPSNSTKKKKKNVIQNTSPFRSSPRISRLRPTSPTKSNLKNQTISNKRKLDFKKAGTTTNSTPSKKKPTRSTTTSTINTTSPVTKKTPPTATVTQKLTPTAVATIKASEEEYTEREMKAFEKQLIADRVTFADDPNELKLKERIFSMKLVTIFPRAKNSNKKSSAVWKYCKEIKLTEYGESLYKKGTNFIYCLDHHYDTLISNLYFSFFSIRVAFA
jgi:hypothetical protein